MVIVERPADMHNWLGKVIGTSDWVQITQEQINKFAEATLDFQWIHVDVERAKKEMPGGKTIAHGYLSLSLVAGLGGQVYKIEKRSRGVNYGLNKVRFINPVPVGSRVRLSVKIANVENVTGGVRTTQEVTMEIEGQPKPALVAETMVISYD
jgi:acyl dehydratase